jgi:hypothetical protein
MPDDPNLRFDRWQFDDCSLLPQLTNDEFRAELMKESISFTQLKKSKKYNKF